MLHAQARVEKRLNLTDSVLYELTHFEAAITAVKFQETLERSLQCKACGLNCITGTLPCYALLEVQASFQSCQASICLQVSQNQIILMTS